MPSFSGRHVTVMISCPPWVVDTREPPSGRFGRGVFPSPPPPEPNPEAPIPEDTPSEKPEPALLMPPHSEPMPPCWSPAPDLLAPPFVSASTSSPCVVNVLVVRPPLPAAAIRRAVVVLERVGVCSFWTARVVLDGSAGLAQPSNSGSMSEFSGCLRGGVVCELVRLDWEGEEDGVAADGVSSLAVPREER